MILCTVCFPQPVIATTSRIVYSLFAEGQFKSHNDVGISKLAVFPYTQLQVFSREIKKVMCILKQFIHFDYVHRVLLTLKYQMVSFRIKNKIVILSLPHRCHFFIARARPDLF